MHKGYTFLKAENEKLKKIRLILIEIEKYLKFGPQGGKFWHYAICKAISKQNRAYDRKN